MSFFPIKGCNPNMERYIRICIECFEKSCLDNYTKGLAVTQMIIKYDYYVLVLR